MHPQDSSETIRGRIYNHPVSVGYFQFSFIRHKNTALPDRTASRNRPLPTKKLA